MTTEKPNLVNQVAGLLILVIIVLVYYFRFSEAPKINGETLTTTGHIIEIGKKGMRGLDDPTIFKYEVNGKEYENSFKVPLPCSSNSELSNHTYQVAYSKKKPEESRLLVSSKLFEEYNLVLDKESQVFYDKFWDCD